jgi:hypothetical protein
MASIESAVIRVVVDVSDQLSARLTEQLPQPAPTSAATTDLFTDLGRPDVEALHAYLDSPGFATVVVQKRIGNMAGKAAKDQLREGLRLAGMSDHPLSRVTDIVHDVMIAACQDVDPHFGTAGARIDRRDLYTAATNNSILLRRLKSSARIHTFAARLRDQVVALHSKIRMPHIGVSRSVRYDQLYVEPTLASKSSFRLGSPGERVLVQGDPGAGKSTLAAKLAHDVAVDGTGRVPFLLVLREFATSFDEGGRDLVHYLEKLCQAPYNVKPPRDGVEYLLRTGRAVVVLDGLDELVQTELRRRVVTLVEGFAHLYPLVPILVTARKVGYEDAPLSADLFASSQIAEFDDDQVAAYVSRWFKLDEATSPAEQDQLISSFMEDSAQISELRSNALLLTLLCAMYSSDRYLPHNLAQVYERCALMLFEQWDSKRGIDLPLRFHGRLRGAVQHLAWNVFSLAESGKPQTRTKVINTLAAYLDKKLDDHDQSVAMAEEFLAHCTGRAWILADVGATESEPQFGFTHRTFLEYFAAEYLVRTHRTAQALWMVLKPNVEQWDVVAQIVLQLYERNFEGGADELLSEALSDGGLGFATRSLHYFSPSDRIVKAIAAAALDLAAFAPLDSRLGAVRADLGEVDGPLQMCFYRSSPLNRPAIQQAILTRFSELISAGVAGAAVLVDYPFGGKVLTETWNGALDDLVHRNHTLLVNLRKTLPWGGGFAFAEPGFLHHLVRCFGVRALYNDCWFEDLSGMPSAVGVLMSRSELALPQAEADLITTTISTSSTPWIDDSLLNLQDLTGHLDGERDVLRLVLALPFLEALAGEDPEVPLPPVLEMLRLALLGDRTEALDWLDRAELPLTVRDFLARWVRGEIMLTEPNL